jgi:ubiquinone/menaquinone biosynthesis C-methylase UbiE
MAKPDGKLIHEKIKQNYAFIASGEDKGCDCSSSNCCGSSNNVLRQPQYQISLGYTSDELTLAPISANLGLGCGNPLSIAELNPGETVLDLGSGAGFDCFLAAQKVGSQGKVIGIDMTAQMIRKAVRNAKQGHFNNIDFYLAEIEPLPLPTESVDIIISNCVINLSQDKFQVFKEAYRVLKPGGRLAISDVVAISAMPEEVLADLSLHSACIAGAMHPDQLNQYLQDAGFRQIALLFHDHSKELVSTWSAEIKPETFIQSTYIKAQKQAN